MKKLLAIMVIMLLSFSLMGIENGKATLPIKDGRLEIGIFGGLGALGYQFNAISGAQLENELYGTSDSIYSSLASSTGGGGYGIGLRMEYFLKKKISIFSEFSYRFDTYFFTWDNESSTFFTINVEQLHLTFGAKFFLGNWYLGVAGYITSCLSAEEIFDNYLVADDFNRDLKGFSLGVGVNFYLGKKWRINDSWSIDTAFMFSVGFGSIIDNPDKYVTKIYGVVKKTISVGLSYAL